MMKTKRNIIFALLAAFALIFAASCSDGSDEDWDAVSGADTEQASSEQGGNTGSGQGESGGSEQSESDGGTGQNTAGEQSESGDGESTGNEQGSTGEQDSSGEQGTGGEQGSAGEQGGSTGGEAQLAEITEDNVTELLQKIGTVVANDSAESSCYWDFANGVLEADADEGFIFTVPLNNSSSYKPKRKTTLFNLNEKGIVSTEFLIVDLSTAEWKDKPASYPLNTRGTIIADIELADAVKSSYTIPENLKSVTIVLTSTDGWVYV